MFLVFLAAQNLKNTILSGIMILVFLAAENLKSAIPAPPIVARVSGNRVFGVFSCPKPQKYDSLLSCRGTG